MRKEKQSMKHSTTKRSFIFGCYILFLRCLDRKLGEGHLHKKAGWRWRQHTEGMKVFQKMRAKLEPTLEENQKKGGGRWTKSAEIHTDHTHTSAVTQDEGRWTGKESRREQRRWWSNGLDLPAELFKTRSSSQRWFTEGWAHVATPLRLKRSGGNQNWSAQLAENQTLKAERDVEREGETWRVKKALQKIKRNQEKYVLGAHLLIWKTSLSACVCVCMWF